ncbi:MAG: ABC transporter substrate-binding protein [Halanaerobium sp.]
MKYQKFILIVIIILFLFTLSIQAANYGGRLDIKVEQRPINLNPIYASDSTAQMINQQIFDTLVSYDQNGNLIENLAESWEISKRGTVFKFKLKEEVHFQPYKVNNKQISLTERNVEAEDWKWSFEYLASPANKSPYAELLNKVKGYRDYREGKSNEISGIKVLDKYQLEIELTESYAPFIYNLAEEAAVVLPKKAVSNNENNFSTAPTGTGPFKFKNFSDQYITVERNKDYWKNNYQEEKLPYLDEIKIHFSAAEIGQEDYQQYDIYQLQSKFDEKFQDEDKINKNYRFKNIPDDFYYYLGINYNNNLKSSQSSEDIKKLLISVLSEDNFSAEKLLESSMFPAGNKESNLYIEKLQNSIQDNVEGEIKIEAELPVLEFINSQSDKSENIAKLIKDKLRDNKIEVDREDFSWSEYIRALKDDQLKSDLFLMTYQYQNRFEFLKDNFYSDSELNFFNYKNSRLDNLVDYLKLADTKESQEQAYQIIEEILISDKPLMFLMKKREPHLISKKLVNQDLFDSPFSKNKFELLYFK